MIAAALGFALLLALGLTWCMCRAGGLLVPAPPEKPAPRPMAFGARAGGRRT